MKRALMSAAVLAFASVGTYAYTVGIVDMQKVFSSPHGVQQIQSQLEQKFAGQRDSMMKKMKDFQAESAKYTKDKAVMSKKDQDQAETKLKKEQNDLQMEQAKYQQAVMTAQADAMKNFVEEIKKAASDVAKKNDLDAVFVNNSILYSKDAKDVTTGIVDNMK